MMALTEFGAKNTSGGNEVKVPLQFSSDLDRLINDLVIARTRVSEFTHMDRMIQPTELELVELKLQNLIEGLQDGEEPT